MSFKGRFLEAAENAIVSYVQPDGTALKVGEMLPQDQVADFSEFIVRSIEANMGSAASASVEFLDEQSIHVAVEQHGKFAETGYRWELGGFFDLDGDGEIG